MQDQQQDKAALARAAGLTRAWEDHRGDVEEAIAGVARLRAGFARPAEPSVEPTPAYRLPRTATESGR